MSKRTITKRMRAYDLSKDITGKPVVVKRDTLKPAEPRMPYEVDCGDKGKVTVMVSEGQMINPKRICKNLN